MLRERVKTILVAVLIIMAITVAIATGLKDSGVLEEHVTLTTTTGEIIYDGPAK